MSANNFPIHEDEFHPVPKLVEPNKTSTVVDLEEEIFIKTVETTGTANGKSLPLRVRVKKIPTKCLAVFKDSKWMTMVVDFFAIGSSTCALVGTSAAKFVPYLSIASSPFYLYHAIKNAQERFKLMACAFKTSRVADTIFWGGRGVGSVGTALSDIAKPFAGSVALFGLAHIPAVGLTFSVILPIVLIVFSVIGGNFEGWAMIRAAKVLQQFNKRKDNLDGSLESLETLLEFIQGPVKVKTNAPHFELEDKHFKENHFTNDRRREAVQARVEALLGHHDLHKIRSLRERLASAEVKHAVGPILIELQQEKAVTKHPEMQVAMKLVGDIHLLYEKLLNPDASDFQRIDTAIALYDQVITLFEDKKYAHAWKGKESFVQSFVQEMKTNRSELYQLKKTLYKEGIDLIDTTHSEIHRVISQHVAGLLVAILTLAAGIMFLLPSSYHTVATALSLASTGVSLINVLFDKAISQKSFMQLERLLHLLEKRKELEIKSV